MKLIRTRRRGLGMSSDSRDEVRRGIDEAGLDAVVAQWPDGQTLEMKIQRKMLICCDTGFADRVVLGMKKT